MATATYRSNSSPSTTLTLDISEVGREGTERTFRVNWSVSLGSGTGLGTGYPRTLSIYKSDGALCGQSEIKSSSTVWSAGGSYKGSFDITINVGATAEGSISLYGMTNSDSIGSCVWNNRSYCTDIAVPYSASTLFKFNGQSVTALLFNGQPVEHLVYNGSTIF